MTSSRLVWGIKADAVTEAVSNDLEEEATSTVLLRRYRHWPDVLDLLTDIQSKYKIIPMPVGESGVTSAGGSLELVAGRISLACMHGEMNAQR